MNGIRGEIKAERAKMKDMDFTQKRQYIWEYYKIQIIIALAVLALGIMFVRDMRNSTTEFLYIAWLQQYTTSDTLREISQALEVIVDYPGREVVPVMSYATTGNPQMDMGLQQRFTAMLHLGGIDLFVVPYRGLAELVEVNFATTPYQVISLVDSPGIQAEINQRLTPAEGINIGIALADSALFNYLEIDATGLYLSVVNNTTNFEAIARALTVIFGGMPYES